LPTQLKDPPIDCCPERQQSSPQVYTLFQIICFNNIITLHSDQGFFVEIQFNKRLLKHHTSKCTWGVKIKLHTFLISIVGGQDRRIPASVTLPSIESSGCYYMGRLSGLESVLAWCGRLISLTLPGVEPQSCSPHLLMSLTRVFRSAFCMDFFFYVCCIVAQLIHLD
jgi:hypothetical protein